MAETSKYYPSQILLGLVMVALQSTLLARLGGVDFMTALILFIALQRSVLGGAFLVFFLGGLLDATSGSPLGLHSFLYLIFYFAAHTIHRQLNLSHPFQQMLVLMIGLIFVHLSVNYYYGSPQPTLRHWLAWAFSVVLSPAAIRLFMAVEALQARLLKPLTAAKP